MRATRQQLRHLRHPFKNWSWLKLRLVLLPAALLSRSRFVCVCPCVWEHASCRRARVGSLGSACTQTYRRSHKHTHSHIESQRGEVRWGEASLSLHTLSSPSHWGRVSALTIETLFISIWLPLVALISFSFRLFFSTVSRARSLAKGNFEARYQNGHCPLRIGTNVSVCVRECMCVCVGSSSSVATPTYFVDGPEQALKKHLTDTHTRTQWHTHTHLIGQSWDWLTVPYAWDHKHSNGQQPNQVENLLKLVACLLFFPPFYCSFSFFVREAKIFKICFPSCCIIVVNK